MYSKETFARRLKDLLDKRGMTQRALSEKLETTEVTVSRYVSGYRTPNIETTVEIAEILGVSLNELVGIDPPAKERPSPDVSVLVSCYSKASPDDRKVLWSLLDRYMTPEQRVMIQSILSEEKAAAV